jgi:hypothetical protein
LRPWRWAERGRIRSPNPMGHRCLDLSTLPRV